MGRTGASQVAAEHHLVYLLSMRGYEASLPAKTGGDIFVCSADGLRLALLQVFVLDDSGRARRDDTVVVARNRACLGVELGGLDHEPVYFVVPSAVFAQATVWPRSSLLPYRDAWRLLGLDAPRLRIAS